jgi:hypothetical protein
MLEMTMASHRTACDAKRITMFIVVLRIVSGLTAGAVKG